MLWQGRRGSSNVEDRRGMGGRGMAIGGGIGSVVIGLIIYLLGGDPSQVMNDNVASPTMPGNEQQLNDETSQFVKVVLADTEDVWNEQFRKINKQYSEPTLVLFTQATQSGCGHATDATGPFYCPADQKVYIDLSFFDEMDKRFNAPGDFAEAYVVAHEVGHHVQNLLGISGKVDAMRGKLSKTEMNALSVRLELQADFLAGVWAHHNQKLNNVLQPGDIDEALNAANAIGDDRLQKQSQGYVVPDAFTHGTSEQRKRWFKKGFESGDLSQGDTFNTQDL